MATNILNSFSLLSYKNLNHGALRAVLVMLLFALGAGNAWAGHDKHTATLNVNKGTGSGTVYASTSGSATSGSASASFNCGESEDGQHTGTLYAYATPASGYTFLGWTTSASSSAGADNSNPKGVVFNVTDASSTQTLYAHFVEKAKVNITFVAPSNGTYTIKVNGGSAETVSSANVVKSNVEGVTLTATPASGYAFAGWYKLNSAGEFVEDLSIASPYDAAFTKSETIKMGARFVPTTLGKFILKGSSTQYYGLKMATIAAGGSGTIVPVAEETLVDGSDLMPFDNGTYTIKAGATLLVPYSSANEVQTKPKDIAYNSTGWTKALSIYKKLKLGEGVNINVLSGGVVCVGGQLVSFNGGNPSAYPIGACGVIDMSSGGHIELNGTLYCWGFIKGQDMDQGNNTTAVGTITANNGAVIWEDFAVGDWRGGTACSTIAGKASSWKFFPFQSYTIQNVEVPTTYKYGSTLSNYTNVYGGGGKNEGTFSLIGKSNTLFLLKDASSFVRKWYDPTTDLVNYELSGTAQLDALNVDAGITTVSSSSYNLPISSNMQIVLTNCNMTISKPMIVQPGAVIEIKNDATLTLASNAYIFDVDNWGMYCNARYFYSMDILTSHKNRGTGTSKELLDDATLIVDGTLNVTGKLYTTAGGADIMGNGGGSVKFSSLGGSGNIVMCTGVSTNENVAIAQANMHNEDDSYTQTEASTFYNVNSRWFITGKQNINSTTHVYDEFKFISSGAVSGTGGTTTTTPALYGEDKTGLVAGMKWCNVTQDGTCPAIYNATQDLNGTPAANIRYTYQSSDWLQLLKTETEGVYGGSDNSLYAVDGCAVNSLGSVDENCLYTIGGVKKALVDGHFVALEKNTEDEAWHDVANQTNYYISFAGCTWHPATKEIEEKAYTVEGGIYIWYGGDWKLVEREAPYFFDYNDQNVKRYYEYEDGAWVLASPRVRVQDAIETRDFYFLSEAFTVANGKKNTTITLLKDIPMVATSLTYSAKNTTCTLDLNGHTMRGAVPYTDKNNIGGLIVINASGSTFAITDNSDEKNGRIENIKAQNQVTYGVLLSVGTLNVSAGTIHVENNGVYNNSNYASLGARAIQQAANTTLNISGGRIESFAGRNAYGILQDANATTTTTLTMTGGDIYVEAPAYAYGVSAKNVFNFSNGTITVRLNTSTVNSNTSDTNADRINHRYGYGIMMTGAANATASSNIFSTLNMTGGKVYSYNDNIKTTTQLHTYGIYFNGGSTNVAVGGSAAVDGTYSQKWSAKGTISNAEIYVENTGRTAYGVFVVGNYNSKDNKSHVVKISNTKITTYASYDAIGVYANAYIGTTSNSSTRNLAAMYHADIELNNCEVKAETTSSVNAYAVYGISTSNTIYSDQTEYDASSKTDIAQTRYTGEYATASKITINGGTYSAKSATYNAFAIYTPVRSITTYGTDTKVYADKTPGGHKKDSVTLVVNGGTFNATSGSYQAYGIHSGGKTTIDDATFNVVAGSYYAYGLYVPSGKLTATNVQVNDTAKGRVKSSDNNAYAYGVQAHCGIPSGNTAQTGFAYAGEVELNNCTINAIATTYQNARGIFVNATSKLHNWAQFKADSLSNKWSKDNYNQFSQVFPCTQQGKDNVWVGIAAKVTINGGTINVKAHTTTAYGAFVNRALKYSYTKPNTILDEYQGQLEINNATFVVKTEGTTTAEGIRSYGQTTITDGSFTVKPKTTTAYGIKLYAGKTTVNGNPEFNVTATTTAYGILVGGGEQPSSTTGATYNGEVEVNGGTFNVETTTDKPAYGVYVYGDSRPITSTAAGYYAGNYASAGKAVINNGEFNVKSKKTDAYGIYMSPAVSQSGATGYAPATATPICEVNGGTFTAEGTTDIAYGAYVSNGVTLKVTDGAFKGKLTSVAADKYAVGAYIAAGGILNATGGSFEAEAAKSGLSSKQKAYACGLYTPDGAATISASNATFKGELKSNYLTSTTTDATSWSGGAYGVYARTTNPLSLTNCTITGNSAYQGGFGLRFANTPAEVRNCTVNVTTTKAYNYGLFVGGASCDVKLYDCSFTCTSGTTYAYGIYAYNGATYAENCTIDATVQRTGASSAADSYLYGVLVASGKTATLKGCTITATGSGKYSNNGYGVYVDGTANMDNCDVSVSNINDGAYALFNTSNTTLLNVASGKYKASATTNAASTNGTAASAKQTLNGGYYSHNTNLSKYAVSPKKVLTLRESHTLYPDYKYTINEGGTVTWKNGDETLKTEMYESGETPEYTGATPTKTADAQYTYTFSGWTPAIAAMENSDVTYTATFSKTENKYTVSVAAGANGAVSPASVSGIGCETASADITATPDAGYTFSGWTLPEGVTAANGYSATSNPIHIHAIAADKTITANFAARTDISYTVKHWQQNIADDDYTEVTADQETLQGTTATLTAATAKTYTGFTALPIMQETIAGEGTTVVNIYYDRKTYTITWVDCNGTTIKTDQNVKYGTTPAYTGSTPTKSTDEQYSYTFTGWSPALATVTEAATYTATFSSTPRTYAVTLHTDGGTINAGDVTKYTYGTGATLPTNVTKDGHEFGGWFDNEGLTGDAVTSISNTATGNKEYWAKWTASIADRELDIVDWTSNSVTINVTNLKAVGGTNKNNWAIRVNDTDYPRTTTTFNANRTLTVTGLSLKPNENLLIQLKNDEGVIESQHNYKIPQIYNAENATLSGTTSSSVVYVYGGKLTISDDITLAALYVCPGAEVKVTDGSTLTVGKLVLRTKPWATAAISGNVSATNVYYTRIAPDGSASYPTGKYYQFGLPYECAISAVRLSDGTTPAYNTTWILKSYDEESRATYGATGENWDVLASSGTIAAGRGYEMFSTYKYYREYYFPVTPTENTSVDVTRHGEDKNNSGWNIVCSPLMNVYKNPSNFVDGLKVSWLRKDGYYDQEWPETIWPAMPFSYQASANGSLDFSKDNFNQTVSAPRRAAYKENIQTEWIHLDVKDGNGVGDHTSVFVHPDRFEDTYETGIDVAKQSLTASRALLYSTHAYGDMAFAGVSDSKLTNGIPLMVYSPKAQELTISMRENNWLNRLTAVWLIDHETGIRTDLLWSTYTFDATEGTAKGRFTLMGEFKAPQVTTGLENGQSDQEPSTKARKVIIEDKIYIQLNGHMYDSTGKKVN